MAGLLWIGFLRVASFCYFYPMCYDLAYLNRRQRYYEERFKAGFVDGVTLTPTHHASGFDHPELPVITGEDPGLIQFYNWGLIPSWQKDMDKALSLSNNTLNARGEEMFDKPSFQDSAINKRCLVPVDGFFEHHHHLGKIYPYYIRMKSQESFALAGLWSRWYYEPENITKYTVSIVTTAGNSMLERIHNNPKLDGPRMPFIVPEEAEQQWIKKGLEPVEINDLIFSYDPGQMESFTVPRLRGKQAVGNDPKAIEPHHYEELESQQGSLF